MEISRDGRRVPELIDTSAAGPTAEYTHGSRRRERETGWVQEEYRGVRGEKDGIRGS